MSRVTSLVLICLFFLSVPAFSEAESPALGCLAKLDVRGVVREALSPEAQTLLSGVGGTWHLEKAQLPADWPEQPWYPYHGVFEFEFRADIPELVENRAALCDVLASRLEATCEEVVERSDRLLACTFLTRSLGHDGTVDVLPDNLEPSRRALIVIVNEW